MDTTTKNALSKHIAGIVPVSKINSDFDLIFHPCVMPIENGFYAIQRSIVECAFAGCKTIWVICDDSIAPLIKKICGDFIQDPIAIINSKYKVFPQENLKSIPIFYSPLSYKNQNKEGLGVSVLDGITACFAVSSNISKWVVPQRYYVSSPYGVYDPYLIKEQRDKILSHDSFVFNFENKSVFTNDHLGFSLSPKQFKHCNYLYKRMNTKTQFSLDIIFGDDIMRENMATSHVDSYFNIKDWKGYQTFFKQGLSFESISFWKSLFTGNIKKIERPL